MQFALENDLDVGILARLHNSSEAGGIGVHLNVSRVRLECASLVLDVKTLENM